MTLAASLNLQDANRRCWDIVVIGAGPAGALAARELARRNLAVLLVDRDAFPRWKVCGCCLNGQALAALTEAGLKDLPDRCGAVPLTEMKLMAKRHSASLPLPQGAALSREAFDAALIQAAINAGANFLPQTTAQLIVASRTEQTRSLLLRQQQSTSIARGRLVIAADGLNSRVLADETGHRAQVATHSRIGAGTIVSGAPDFFHRGTIYMACGTGGYVGLVRREDNELTVAAAFDTGFVHRAGGVAHAAQRVLGETDWPALADVVKLPWRGTPALTRQPQRPAGERILALGDAAGYVEPFTGEGMAWALTAALVLAPVAERAVRAWHPTLARKWTRLHRRLVGRRQYLCRALAWTLRSPWLTCLMVRVLGWMPSLAVPFVRYVNSPL